jgi:hypothetical protein
VAFMSGSLLAEGILPHTHTEINYFQY